VKGTVRSKTLAQLKKLDVGRWRRANFAGERILTLEEALECVNGNADLCLEIKTYDHSARGIELKILFIVSHYDYLERTVISSFNYDCLARVRELAPEASIGILFGSGFKADPFEAAKRLGATSCQVQKQIVTADLLSRAWEQGLDVYVWTVNELRDMRALISVGVQGLISDFPERFRKLRRE
jgi:glycerophosphoryl diester phosphodiesterase